MCDYCSPPTEDDINVDFPAKEIVAGDENAGEPILPVALKYLGEKVFSIRMLFEYGGEKGETELAEEFCHQLAVDIKKIFSDCVAVTDKTERTLIATLKGYFGLAGNVFDFNYCPICGRNLEEDVKE